MPARPSSGLPSGNGYHRKGLWAIKKKNGGKWPAAKPAAQKKGAVTKVKEFGKKGQKRTVTVPRTPRNHILHQPTPLVHRVKHNQPKIRDSLQAGTVAVVLSGRFRGKRVVVVKRLPSGLVLITGPFKINGVPLRRVNPAYLIATSTKVVVDKSKFDDATKKALRDKTFERPKKVATKPATDDKVAEKKVIDPTRVALQKTVDSQILAAVKETPLLKEYLHARFSLKNRVYPHAIKF